MSGGALHQRSNPTRWASRSGRGSERFARKGQWVREAVDGLGTSVFAVRAPLGRPSLWQESARSGLFVAYRVVSISSDSP